MKNDNQDNGRKFERIVLYLIIAGFIGFIGFRTIRLVNAGSDSQNHNVAYYQTSPLPTFTFTPTPVAPTNTPPPPTPTDTATPTQLPPTPTDTATPTQLPPTPTDTATPTQLPPTPTDTATPTQLPPTPTDTATPTQLPPTATDTATPTQLPPTPTDTATPTPLPPTPTDTPPPPIPTDTPVPDGDKVTGGGWIDSPPSAYVLDPEATGKANFGFVTNHKNGANAPSGNTTFQFQDGEFKFKSESYLWLAINHNDGAAVYMGNGTANGQHSNFMVWIGDDPDTFRIKIWSMSGLPLYDNGSNQAIGGGSIEIHKDNQ